MTAAPAAAGTSWVARRLGADLVGPRLDELVRLGLRRNPRRAQLLVSTVLGKHIPADPHVVHDAAAQLGAAVAAHLTGRAVVIGFAETATALGHVVAEVLDAPYLHSTRRTVEAVEDYAVFAEEHSHATAHRLLPERPGPIDSADTIVLVDDELSTGRTAANTIAALHARAPHERYVIACLVDVRGDDEREGLREFAESQRVIVDVVALAEGRLRLPVGFAENAARIAAEWVDPPTVTAPVRLESVVRWPARARDGGRHGFGPADVAAARLAAGDCADRLAASIAGADVLVLGTEELMYAPLLIARELADRLDASVRFSSTTRSPVVAIDEPDYPVRTRLTFAAHDGVDTEVPRFAHNVAPGRCGTGYTDIVVVVDDGSDPDALYAGDGLLAALSGVTDRLHLVVIPSYRPLPIPLYGPEFGSYRADEVSWLLIDISNVELERPAVEREAAIQSRAAHYSESLPIEYEPTAEYLDVFAQCLRENARRVAEAVGILTELIVAERGEGAVIASLARAGTPIGILVRRWAREIHGIDLPHHTISIIRGRGIDMQALRYLAVHHDDRDVVFVDGWTGKGAIARELDAAIPAANATLGTAFVPELAVLADPGRCVSTFGTRDDFLIPSACLNSTVSGLVSRTVLNHDVLRDGAYHGAKFYRSLADADVSDVFLAAVTAEFANVRDEVARVWRSVQGCDRAPDWSGWATVERIAADHGISDLNLIKPGIGETTRVLLRRVPWRVLVRPEDRPQLRHVLLLAADRGVEVLDVPGLAFACVGVIRPRGEG